MQQDRSQHVYHKYFPNNTFRLRMQAEFSLGHHKSEVFTLSKDADIWNLNCLDLKQNYLLIPGFGKHGKFAYHCWGRNMIPTGLTAYCLWTVPKSAHLQEQQRRTTCQHISCVFLPLTSLKPVFHKSWTEPGCFPQFPMPIFKDLTQNLW